MPKQRYWDANAFLGWFIREPDKLSRCEGVIRQAEDGNVIIVTSALTLTEVIKIKGQERLKKEQEAIIQKFFEQDYIVLRNVDRIIGNLARNLIWEYPKLKPKDAIHVATAVKLKISILDTFDTDLIYLNGQIGNPPLMIGKPNIGYQPKLSL